MADIHIRRTPRRCYIISNSPEGLRWVLAHVICMFDYRTAYYTIDPEHLQDTLLLMKESGLEVELE